MRYPEYSFFDYIKLRYGIVSVRLFKLWIKIRKNIIVNKLRAKFLRDCHNYQVFPAHFNNNLNNSNVHFYSYNSVHDFKRIKINFLKKLLKLEIDDSYRTIEYNYNQVYTVTKQLINNIPESVCNSFFGRQSGPLYSFYHVTHNKFDKKFKSIIRNNSNILNIKPIRYVRFQRKTEADIIV